VDWSTVIGYVVGVVAIAIGLGVSIALHEWGHLFPAKKFGVYVPKYMIGFGPTLWSRRIGETEYGFKLLPLGGFVALSGMYPPAHDGEAPRDATTALFDNAAQDAAESAERHGGRSAAQAFNAIALQDEPADDPKRMFYLLPWWKRIIVMLGGPVMNLLLAVVAYAIMLCLIGIPQETTTIGSVSQCVLPASSTATECSAADAASPASAAGIEPGDRLISIDGTAVTDWVQATGLIRADAEQTIPVVVERDGEQLTLTATPIRSQRVVIDDQGDAVLDADGQYQYVDAGFLGISPAYATTPQPVTAVLPQVWSNIAQVGEIIVQLPVKVWDTAATMFDPSATRDPNGPLSVVGVGRLAGEITSLDTVPFLDKIASVIGIFASLNVALFVFNLIPLLPLDGGHVVGALWDALRRGWARIRQKALPRPIDISRLTPLTMAVFALLAVMSVVLILADIVKPITLQ